MITAPVYFKIEQQGYSNLGNISDYDDIYAPSVYLFKKTTVAANPKLPELLMKAHAEAIKRFYEDKAFAVKAYLAWDKQDPAELERTYDHYAQGQHLRACAVHSGRRREIHPGACRRSADRRRKCGRTIFAR